MKKYILTGMLFLMIHLAGFSQEVISGLQTNPVIKNYLKTSKVRPKIKTAALPLNLPFFDDFSYAGPYPLSEKWVDHYAFVNTDYALFAPSVGVATLDVLNENGEIYPNATIYPFIADYLTSQPIRLDSVFSPVPKSVYKNDSVYLSFFYQPQGRGNAPETDDILALEFIAPNQVDSIITETDTTVVPHWNRIWSSDGMSIDSFYSAHHSYFQRVMIPVIDSIYFDKNFQFRFVNYASISNSTIPGWQSNADNWNVDYVYLNLERSLADTVFHDVTFVDRAPSMLKKYESMPMFEYSFNFANEMQDTLDMLISNLDNTSHTASYRYEVLKTEDNSLIHTYDGGSYDILPFYQSGYVTHLPFARPIVDFPYPITSLDSIEYTVKHILTNDTTVVHPENDTLTYIQKFSNYYAYDDGTPEAGYGLTPTGAKLAYRFTLKKPATLTAVEIFFNSQLTNDNQIPFYLMVWDDIQNHPGNVLYESVRLTPTEKNYFTTYAIADTVLGLSEKVKTFYVGIVQTTDENLNIGYDRFNNARSNTLYNTDGQWNESIYKGALMIRPVFSKDYTPPVSNKSVAIKVSPNPVYDGNITFELPEGMNNPDTYNLCRLSIYNVYGEKVYYGAFSPTMNAGFLSRGLYMFRIENQQSHVSFSGKLVVAE